MFRRFSPELSGKMIRMLGHMVKVDVCNHCNLGDLGCYLCCWRWLERAATSYVVLLLVSPRTPYLPGSLGEHQISSHTATQPIHLEFGPCSIGQHISQRTHRRSIRRVSRVSFVSWLSSSAGIHRHRHCLDLAPKQTSCAQGGEIDGRLH